MAGNYPGSISTDEALNNLRWLLQNGINSFLDLTEEGEGNLPAYSDLLEIEAGKINSRVKYKPFPIRDFDVPTVPEMSQILKWITAGIADGDTLYVHCYGGKGRTGTVIGCYLVEQGYTGEAAINQIAILRGDPPGSRVVSPETLEQKNMVYGWNKSLD